MHASELQRMGARISIDGHIATVTGPTPLTGAPLIASDLRASGRRWCWRWLVAKGETIIDRVYHIDARLRKDRSQTAGGGRGHRTIRESVTAPLSVSSKQLTANSEQ